jgi:hypothetical protein
MSKMNHTVLQDRIFIKSKLSVTLPLLYWVIAVNILYVEI